jgi:hypothetical protein
LFGLVLGLLEFYKMKRIEWELWLTSLEWWKTKTLSFLKT